MNAEVIADYIYFSLLLSITLILRSEYMLKIAILMGSTRPGRNNDAVAKWVLEHAQKRGDAEYELVDIKDYNLPLFDEPYPPSYHNYTKDYTKHWAEKIAQFDGFVIVTPEYNHAPTAALKNALDYLYAEWNDKAVGFVGYGSVGAARAIENLRLIAGELQMADVRTAVHLSLFTDFENFKIFKPIPIQEETLKTMLDQLIRWAGALKTLRTQERIKKARTGLCIHRLWHAEVTG